MFIVIYIFQLDFLKYSVSVISYLRNYYFKSSLLDNGATNTSFYMYYNITKIKCTACGRTKMARRSKIVFHDD